MALEKKNHKLEIKFHLIPCSKQLACIWYAGDKKKEVLRGKLKVLIFGKIELPSEELLYVTRADGGCPLSPLELLHELIDRWKVRLPLAGGSVRELYVRGQDARRLQWGLLRY